MTEQTLPAYGASIKIEETKAGFYLREKALDAVQEQVVEDLNAALRVLDGRDVLIGTDYEAINGLASELRRAAELADVAAEVAFSKRPLDDEDAS